RPGGLLAAGPRARQLPGPDPDQLRHHRSRPPRRPLPPRRADEPPRGRGGGGSRRELAAGIWTPPPNGLEAPEFRLDISTLVEGEAAVQEASFAGGAVGELRVGVEAGDGGVGPGAVGGLPGRDYPAVAGLVVAGGVRSGEDLVVVRRGSEAGGALQHDAVLDA